MLAPCSGFGIRDLGFAGRRRGSGFRVQSSGFWVLVLGSGSGSGSSFWFWVLVLGSGSWFWLWFLVLVLVVVLGATGFRIRVAQPFRAARVAPSRPGPAALGTRAARSLVGRARRPHRQARSRANASSS